MGSKALTIDGRPWEYRDPYNKKEVSWGRGDRGDAGRPEPRNDDAYEFTNPLYDYSKGRVSDAARELGIGNVDEKQEVKRILKYIREGGRNREEEQSQPEPAPTPAPTPTPEPPPPPRGSTFTEDTKTFEETRLQRPENQAPRQTFTQGPEAGSRDAIRYGEDINSHYINKFIPSLEADARLTAQEIGESGRFHLDRFVGKVPELGDPKDMFEYYSAQIRGDDDDEDEDD